MLHSGQHQVGLTSAGSSPGRFAQIGLALVAGLGVALAAPSASAYPNFPGYMQDILALKCAPSCLLCHTTAEGGKDHMKPLRFETPVPGRGFGTFWRNLTNHQDPSQLIQSALPLEGGEPSQAALAAALQKLETEMCIGAPDAGETVCDSDGDSGGDPTKLDVAELRANQDPDNGAVDAPLCLGPYYGCGAHVAPAPAPPRSSDAGALLAALGVALVLARRLRA